MEYLACRLAEDSVWAARGARVFAMGPDYGRERPYEAENGTELTHICARADVQSGAPTLSHGAGAARHSAAPEQHSAARRRLAPACRAVPPQGQTAPSTLDIWIVTGRERVL